MSIYKLLGLLLTYAFMFSLLWVLCARVDVNIYRVTYREALSRKVNWLGPITSFLVFATATTVIYLTS